MHEYTISDELRKELKKLHKKDKKRKEATINKIKEIINNKNPNHYKNLRKPLQHLKRVHIDKNFILLFKYKQETIHFITLTHHDDAYK